MSTHSTVCPLLGKRFVVSRLPPWIKSPLVKAWNQAHQWGWAAADFGGAIVHWRLERCAVCGRSGLMLLRRRVIPRRLIELWGLSRAEALALARKESLDCCWCGAKLRARRLAQVLLERFPVDGGAIARSLRDWARSEPAQKLAIAEINRIDGVHEQLARVPKFRASDFIPGTTPGAIVEGTRSEDLTRLTYPDLSFDVVLTSESLEHVPDLSTALGELHRVLRPGGVHIFTIPLLPRVRETWTRAVRDDGGRIAAVSGPLLHHPGGDVGYAVFTEFGQDATQIFERAGFACEVLFGPARESDLAQVYVCRKR